MPAGQEEAADQGEAAKDCPKRQAGDGGNCEGAALTGGGGDLDLVAFPAKRDMGGSLWIGGLESGNRGRWESVFVVEGDGNGRVVWARSCSR